jgi:hypothetical protein
MAAGWPHHRLQRDTWFATLNSTGRNDVPFADWGAAGGPLHGAVPEKAASGRQGPPLQQEFRVSQGDGRVCRPVMGRQGQSGIPDGSGHFVEVAGERQKAVQVAEARRR